MLFIFVNFIIVDRSVVGLFVVQVRIQTVVQPVVFSSGGSPAARLLPRTPLPPPPPQVLGDDPLQPRNKAGEARTAPRVSLPATLKCRVSNNFRVPTQKLLYFCRDYK